MILWLHEIINNDCLPHKTSDSHSTKSNSNISDRDKAHHERLPAASPTVQTQLPCLKRLLLVIREAVKTLKRQFVAVFMYSFYRWRWGERKSSQHDKRETTHCLLPPVVIYNLLPQFFHFSNYSFFFYKVTDILCLCTTLYNKMKTVKQLNLCSIHVFNGQGLNL